MSDERSLGPTTVDIEGTCVDARLPDEKDREAAKSSGDQVILVEAAAGTGKTTLLVDRILHILLHERHPRTGEPASLRDIAAITFTEKAAAEMRERLRDRIEEKLQNGPATPERDRLRQALGDLDCAQITTIHSFCGSLLRECPVEAQLDPETVVADALLQGILVEEAFERWLERMLADERPLEENPVALFLDQGSVIGRRGSDNRRSLSLRGIARRLIENRELLPYLESVPEDFDEALQKVADELLAEAEKILVLCGNSKRTNKIRDFLEEFVHAIRTRKQVDTPQLRARLEELVERDCRSDAKKFFGGQENLDRAKKLCERIKFALSISLNARTVNLLVEEMKKLIDEYEKLKRQRGQLDFLDLLLKAAALVENPHVRDYIAARYPFLLIDEFQDTDPIQAKLVQSLLAAESVRPKLFLVGDPKQSIYRFRRADIETYSATLDALARDHGAKKLFLTCNFRSVPSILQFVNHVCEPVIRQPKDGAYQPDYVPLKSPPGAKDLDRPAVHYLKPPSSLVQAEREERGSERPLRRDDVREIEGYVVAQFLQQICAQGWPVRDEEELRPIRLSDMAILLERRNGLDAYEVGFQAAGMPYRLVGGKAFYTRIEIKSVLAVLRALENPMSELRVVAALRSPIFGLSDEDLVEHRLAQGGQFNYLTGGLPNTAVGAALGVLHRLYDRREKRPVYRVIEQLYDETGAVELFASLPDGADRAANLLHLLDMCRRLEAAEPQTFRSLLEWLESMASETEEETEVPDVEFDNGAVQILTIHRSKGLEFPLVVVGGFSCPREIKVDPPLVDRSSPDRPRLGFAFSKTLATPGWPDMQDKEKKRLHAERIRLLYVALTRARDYLVLPVSWPYSPRKSEYSLEDLIRPRLELDSPAPQPGARVQVHGTDQWGTFSSVPPNPRIDPAGFRGEKTERAVQRLLAEADEIETWLNAARQNARQGLRITRPSEEAEHIVLGEREEGGRTGRPRNVGIAVHKILEVAVRKGEALKGKLSQETIQAVFTQMQMDSSTEEEAVAHAERTLESEEFRQLIRSATRLLCEVPLVGRGEGEGDLVEGVADLLAQTEDGWIVVDYKTDRVQPGEEPLLVQKYGEQVRAYANVLRQALGQSGPVRARILATATGKLVDVPLQ